MDPSDQARDKYTLNPSQSSDTQDATNESKKQTIKDYFSSRISSLDTPPLSPADEISAGTVVKKSKVTASNERVPVVRIGNKRVRCDTTDIEGIPRRGNSRAKLARLPTLPLDVLCEIFTHLPPVDLLHLTRTTKALRRLLLHPSATSVWRTAFESVPELPQCPDDVSLPFWTNLLFDTHCHNCAAVNVRNVDFVLRVRYCVKCAKIKLMPLPTSQNHDKFEILRKSVPVSSWGGSNIGECCTITDASTFNKVLASIEGDRSAFLQQKQHEVKVRCEGAKEAKKWLLSVTADREFDLEMIREEREQAIHLKLVTMGYAPELRFLNSLCLRSCAILPPPKIVMFSEHPLVTPARALTERIWNNIEFRMVDYMLQARRLLEEDKLCRVKRERRILIHNAYLKWRGETRNVEKYPPHLLMPGPCDIMEFPPIKNFIETPMDTEHDTRLTGALVERALSASLDSWRTDAISGLWKVAHASRICDSLPWCPVIAPTPMSQMLDNLSLAVVTFRCTRNWVHTKYDERRGLDDGLIPPGMRRWDVQMDNVEHCLWYPEFLFHPCNSMTDHTYQERDAGEYMNLSLSKQYDGMRQKAWSSEGLVFDEKAARTTRNILDACGMDYLTTTTQELDDRDPRLVCLKCTRGAKCDGERMVRIWAWRDAVQHSLKAHFGEATLAWECLSPEDTVDAKHLGAIERVKRGYHAPLNQKIWKCVGCRDTKQDVGHVDWETLKSHFRCNPEHGSAMLIFSAENIWYYKALDFSPREQPAVRMIPGKTVSVDSVPV